MGVLTIMGQRLSRLARAVGSRSGRLSRGGRSSRAGCRARAHRPGQAVQAWAGCRGQERQAEQGSANQPRRVPAHGRIALARRFRLGLAVGSRSGRLSRGGRSGRAGYQRAGRIALARRFRLGLAVGSRSGRLSRGGRSSRAGCRARAHRPGQAVPAWAGCRGQERQPEQGSANQPRRVPAHGRIALARRFRLGLAVEGRSGSLSRGRRTSRAGCQHRAHRPGQAVPAWAGCREQERQPEQGSANQPRRVPRRGASPWPGGSDLGWLSGAGAAG